MALLLTSNNELFLTIITIGFCLLMSLDPDLENIRKKFYIMILSIYMDSSVNYPKPKFTLITSLNLFRNAWFIHLSIQPFLRVCILPSDCEPFIQFHLSASSRYLLIIHAWTHNSIHPSIHPFKSICMPRSIHTLHFSLAYLSLYSHYNLHAYSYPYIIPFIVHACICMN